MTQPEFETLSGYFFTRLDIMKRINHPEEYYQRALKSNGVDYTTLTHGEISAFVATCKAIEADILIDMCEKLPASGCERVDLKKIMARPDPKDGKEFSHFASSTAGSQNKK